MTGSDNGAYQNTCAVLEHAIEIMALLDDTRLSYADFCLSFREHLEKFMVALGNVRWYQVSDSRVRSERAHAAFAVLFQALTADLAPFQTGLGPAMRLHDRVLGLTHRSRPASSQQLQ